MPAPVGPVHPMAPSARSTRSANLGPGGRWRRTVATCRSHVQLRQSMAELIVGYCQERLAQDPVPLDFGGARRSLDDVLAGLVRPEGNDPAEVLQLFAEHLAPAVVSIDSPRFLAFIPPRPPRPPCCLTWWSPARHCRERRGWRPRAQWRRRIRRCDSWPTWPDCPSPPGVVSSRGAPSATCRRWWWPGTSVGNDGPTSTRAGSAVAVSEEAHSSVARSLM